MAFLDLIQQLFKHTREYPASTQRVEDLRARLSKDPNDTEAFDELAHLAHVADAERQPRDPLIDETGQIDVSGDLVVWALAEELSMDSASWYPQIKLAELALPDDPATAVRLLGIATDRNRSSEVLLRAMRILMDASLNDQAMNLGVAHWNPREHSEEVGTTLIDAARASHRWGEARAYLRELAPQIDADTADRIAAEIDRDEKAHTGQKALADQNANVEQGVSDGTLR